RTETGKHVEWTERAERVPGRQHKPARGFGSGDGSAQVCGVRKMCSDAAADQAALCSAGTGDFQQRLSRIDRDIGNGSAAGSQFGEKMEVLGPLAGSQTDHLDGALGQRACDL